MTKFNLMSHPQSDVWVSSLQSFANHIMGLLKIWQGGLLVYDESQLDALKKAFFTFDQSSDMKAASGVSLNYSLGQVCSVMRHHC